MKLNTRVASAMVRVAGRQERQLPPRREWRERAPAGRDSSPVGWCRSSWCREFSREWAPHRAASAPHSADSAPPRLHHVRESARGHRYR